MTNDDLDSDVTPHQVTNTIDPVAAAEEATPHFRAGSIKDGKTAIKTDVDQQLVDEGIATVEDLGQRAEKRAKELIQEAVIHAWDMAEERDRQPGDPSMTGGSPP